MVIGDEILKSVLKNQEQSSTVDKLNSWDEEADDRVILHAKWSVLNGAQRIVVLSNDCDTLVLLLRYMNDLLQNGLVEAWLQYGTGEHRRMIPLHAWFSELR